jgi:hypothetical protein
VEILRGAVAAGTNAKYALGWRRWLEFRGQRDPYLRSEAAGEVRVVMLGFFAYLVYGCRATPNTVKGAWLGVVHFMRQDIGGRDVLDDKRLQKDYSDAMKTAERVNPAERKAPTLPTFRDMSELSRSQGHGGTEAQRMVDLAYRLGVQLGSRVGELAQEKSAPHTLMSDGVVFFDKSGQPHPSWEVAETLPRASQAVTVRLFWPTTKVGPRTAYVTRASPEESQLLDDLHLWSARRLMVTKVYFFRAQGSTNITVLQKRTVATHVKNLATQCGLSDTAFSPRSMRVGRATSIRAAQGTKAEADAAGGWSTKSTTSSRYARATPRTSPGKGVTWEDLVIMQAPGAPVVKSLSRKQTASRGPSGR